MNRKIADRFDRAALYLNRVRLALQNNDPAQGMANAAELGYQAGALYTEFRKIIESRNEQICPQKIQKNT